MAAARVCRMWIESRLIWLAGADGIGHGVVDFEDDALGAVVAVILLLVPAANDGEGVHNVGHGVAWSREAGPEPCQVFFRFVVRSTF